MNLLAINIATLRKRTGLSISDLANRIDCGETTVKNIETGYTPNPSEKLLAKLAQTFGATVDGLLGKTPLDVGEKSRAVYVADSITKSYPFIDSDNITDTVFLDRDELEGYDHFGFRMNDESMEGARLFKGDVLIVRKEAPVKSGDTVLVLLEEQTVVRKCFFVGDEVVFKSYEKDGICSELKFEKTSERFIIAGKVVKCLFNV